MAWRGVRGLAQGASRRVDQLVQNHLESRDELEPVPREELLRRVRAGRVVIDVRPREEYRAGHIPGALSIPARGAGTSGWGELPSRKEVVAYCGALLCDGLRSGRQAARAWTAGAPAPRMGFLIGGLRACPCRLGANRDDIQAPSSLRTRLARRTCFGCGGRGSAARGRRPPAGGRRLHHVRAGQGDANPHVFDTHVHADHRRVDRRWRAGRCGVLASYGGHTRQFRRSTMGRRSVGNTRVRDCTARAHSRSILSAVTHDLRRGPAPWFRGGDTLFSGAVGRRLPGEGAENARAFRKPFTRSSDAA